MKKIIALLLIKSLIIYSSVNINSSKIIFDENQQKMSSIKNSQEKDLQNISKHYININNAKIAIFLKDINKK